MSQRDSSSSDSKFDLSALPDWAKQVMSSARPVVSATTQAVTDFVDGSGWPALLNAAVISSFVPRELTTDTADSGPDVADAAIAALKFAEMVHDPEGSKWVLKQDARRSILAAAKKADIQAAVERTRSRFIDPISVALRNQLSGSSTQTDSLALSALEATRIATLWLGEATDSSIPSLEQLNREIALRRLLQPFRQMIGVGDVDGPQVDETKIRFFGRNEQIEQLRSYVGVLPAATILGTLSDFILRVRRTALGPEPPLIVWGVGGVGKTTLIAKFVLEHAEAAASRYPFSYLDFDRATLSARRPVGLLIEMCKQVAAQFEPLTESLRTLQSKAQTLSSDLDISSDKLALEIETFELLAPLLLEFRNIVDQHISSLESRFEFARPFLLVLDTFEIVQYSDKDVGRVETFVRKLTQSEDGRGWSRLRLIISGRKKLPQFLVGFRELALGPLDRKGSIEMAMALARDAGKPINASRAERLISALVGNLTTASGDGVPPLTLKLVGDVFDSAKVTDGDVLVDQLVDELTNPNNQDATLRSRLIDGILVRRILDHVANWRVRALADPGLVVRRISPGVIRQVMARATPDPKTDDITKTADTLDFQPWELSQTDAVEIFEAFRNEVSLVEPDGTDLRHRQDLRQEMLPLIKARRPNRFAKLHELAFAFFAEKAAADPSDHASRAEALYHGLWLGTPLHELDELWPKAVSFFPRIDPAEFAAMPESHRYLRAKTGEPLTDDEIRALPRAIAIDWLVSKSGRFLDDNDPNHVTREVRAAAGSDFSGLNDKLPTAAIVARMLHRTGQWNDSRRVIANHLVDSGQIDALPKSVEFASDVSPAERENRDNLISLLRTWATISAKIGAEQKPLDCARAIASARRNKHIHPVIKAELMSLAALGSLTLMGGGVDWPAGFQRELGTEAARVCRLVPSSIWQGETRTLRFSLLASETDVEESLPELLAMYFRIREIPPREREAVEIVGDTLATIYDVTGDSPTAKELLLTFAERQSSAKTSAALQRFWPEGISRLAAALSKSPGLWVPLKRILLFDHLDWSFPLGNALTRAFGDDTGEALFDALAKEDFLSDSTGKLLSRSGLDGVSVTQRAMSREGLLRLARAIDGFSGRFVAQLSPEQPRPSYPRTVFDIAKGLLRWHAILFQAIGGNEDPTAIAPADVPAKPLIR